MGWPFVGCAVRAVRAVPVIVWRRTRQPRFPPRKGAPRVASRTARQSRDCLRVRPLSDPPPLHGAARLAGAFFATVGTGARRFSSRLHSARMLAHPSGSAHRLAAPSGALRAGSLRSKLLRCISPNLPSASLRRISYMSHVCAPLNLWHVPYDVPHVPPFTKLQCLPRF